MSRVAINRVCNLLMHFGCCLIFVCCLFVNVNGTKELFVKTFDLDLKNTEVASCLEPPLDVEKLDTCLNSSSNNVKKWSYLPDSGECAFLSAAEECALDNGNDFVDQEHCRNSCFYARCFTSPVSTVCEDGFEETDFWFYNPINGSCVRYADGKCPSNANGFEHEMDCYASCSKAPCTIGLVQSRNCQVGGSTERWFVNMTSGRCERFKNYTSQNNCLSAPDAGHGGGNSNNNYASVKECLDMCHCKDDELPGMVCHPALKQLNLATPSTELVTVNLLKSIAEKRNSSTKLPETLLFSTTLATGLPSSTVASVKKNEIIHATVDHVDHSGHEHHHNNHNTTPSDKAVLHNLNICLLFFVCLIICL